MKQSLRRTIRAEVRDARVLLYESRSPLILFVALIIGGALVFHLFYTDPGTGQHPSFGRALHATFALIFFETLFPFPDPWYLRILFFLIPILGLAAVADGVLRFGTALVNKQSRGQKWQVAMASTYNDHVVVCGIGRVGYRVIQELHKFGREVVAIDSNPDGRFVEKAIAEKVPVIMADARRSENLEKAGVQRADAIIPCTSDELTNLEIALDARELNPAIKVVMRMFDPDLARRIEKGFGIHTAFSTSALTAPIFAAAAMRVNVMHAFHVGGRLLNLSQVVVEPGSQLEGWSIEKLETQLDLSVTYYQRNEITLLHPGPDIVLNAGDRVIVVAALEALQQLTTLNLPETP